MSITSAGGSLFLTVFFLERKSKTEEVSDVWCEISTICYNAKIIMKDSGTSFMN